MKAEYRDVDSSRELEVALGERLRAIRLARGMSQAEVARAANVSLGAVRHLELGTGATIRTLVRVARAIGESDWLEKLQPPVPSFSPLAVLEQQRAAAHAQQRRPRVRRTSRGA